MKNKKKKKEEKEKEIFCGEKINLFVVGFLFKDCRFFVFGLCNFYNRF